MRRLGWIVLAMIALVVTVYTARRPARTDPAVPAPAGSGPNLPEEQPESAPFDPLSVPDWFDGHLRFSHARLQPVRGEDGQPLGIRVVSVHPALRPARLGLAAGDLLLRVNGVPLTDPARFGRAVDIVGWTFLRADLVRVRVRREGEEFTLAELGPVKTEPVQP